MSRLESSTEEVPKHFGLDGRYQVIKVLETVGVSQTYLAVDTQEPGNPHCVIKQLQPFSSNPDWQQEATRLLFHPSAEIMKTLGQHDRICQLLDCLEVGEAFYIVQEFIEGQPLSAEISSGQCWNESQALELLQDVLDILGFIHLQGAIHCYLQPDSLVRRQQDNKLVLADLSSIKPLPSYLGAIKEQSGDIYTLGAIAIQALTGLHPLELKDPEKGEIVWQDHATVSEYLAAIINRMVCDRFQDRYKFTIDVLEALQPLVDAEDVTELGSSLGEATATSGSETDTTTDTSLNPAPSQSATAFPLRIGSVRGMPTAGVATSLAFAIGAGGYLVLELNSAEPGVATLVQAHQKYQAGKLQEALTLAQSISPESSAYDDAQEARTQWQKDWQQAHAQYEAIKKAFANSQWLEVVERANQMPNIDFWQQRMELMVSEAQAHLEQESYQLLQHAYDQAINKDFTGALKTLQQVPKGTKAYPKVQAKIAEYQHKQHIKANVLLQEAYNQAAARDFTSALIYLRQIPQDTPAYKLAQQKISEYTQKQRIKANYLLQRAYNQAAFQDYASALTYLEQISKDMPSYAVAQQKITEYTQKQRFQAAKPQAATTIALINQPGRK